MYVCTDNHMNNISLLKSGPNSYNEQDLFIGLMHVCMHVPVLISQAVT